MGCAGSGRLLWRWPEDMDADVAAATAAADEQSAAGVTWVVAGAAAVGSGGAHGEMRARAQASPADFPELPSGGGGHVGSRQWGAGLSSNVAPRQRGDIEAFPSLGGVAGAREEEVWDPMDPDNPDVPSFRQAMLSGWGRTAPPPEGAGGGGGGKRKNKRGTVLFTVG